MPGLRSTIHPRLGISRAQPLPGWRFLTTTIKAGQPCSAAMLTGEIAPSWVIPVSFFLGNCCSISSIVAGYTGVTSISRELLLGLGVPANDVISLLLLDTL